MQRRSIIRAAAALLGAAAVTAPLAGWAQTKARVEVWKTATCGCCHEWVAHLQANGFEVKTYDISDMAKQAQRRQLGLADKFASCHTALIGGYVLEGHVPAREIRRLLKDRPKAFGLAVPGMTVGSPGMDGPAYGGRKDPYAVLLLQRDGSSSVYQSY
jgi:hypothetical protein